MDWGLLTFTRDGRVLRRQRLYLPVISYVLLVVVNFILRFSWLVNRLPGADHLHSSIIVLVIEVGEVFRRALWNIYRIEWEVITQQEKALEKEKALSLSGLLSSSGSGGSGAGSDSASSGSSSSTNTNSGGASLRSPSTLVFSGVDR